MQIKYLNPDGSLKALYPFDPVSPADDIEYARVASISENEGGPYHVVIGENLEDSPGREVYHIVYSAGVEICQNVLNPV